MEIWQITVSAVSDAERARLAQVLSVEEQTRAARYLRAADRLRFQIGHGLARLVSAAHAGVPPERLDWQVSDTGKPAWGNLTLPFNLSHSGDQVWLAIGGDAPLGLDIQEETARADVAALAGFALSPEEQAHLAARDGAARRARFFDLWVLREAAVKATGQGVFASLRSVSALPLPPEGRWGAAPGLGADLWVHQLVAPPGYRAALALHQSQPPQDSPTPLAHSALARILT